MSYSRPGLSAAPTPVARPWTVRRPGAPAATAQTTARPGPTRRYDVSCIGPEGEPMSFAKVAPAVPFFEQAFSAIARGTLMHTTEGQVAVEDLEPGMRIETQRGAADLLWIGAITLLPGMPAEAPAKLYRVPTDAFGLGRPVPDLMMGPGARLVRHGAALREAASAGTAMVPIAQMADGMSVIEVTPMSPVRVFHLACARHSVISANGVEIETFHPGAARDPVAGPGMTELFLSMFPHVLRMSDFGPLAMPQLPLHEGNAISAA